MIRYSCDGCGEALDAEGIRYEVEIDVRQAFDAGDVDDDSAADRDYLQEINQILQSEAELDDEPAPIAEGRRHYDLCPSCAKKFAKNPLGRKLSKEFNFSQN